MKLKIVTITDLHFGQTDEARLYSEIESEVYPFLEETRPDIVVIGGDLFDKRVSMNHPAAIYANRFIDRLQDLCDTVWLIHGTLSHDALQVDSYSHLLSDKFRIFKVATVEYIKGMKILILPEEYPSDKESYYKPFFEVSEKYDWCFGHGMFKHVGASGHESEKKNSVNWTAAEFDQIIHARVMFGHIHQKTVYKKVIYGGSLTRMSHGDEDPKGFYYHEYDPETKKILKERFVENTKAPIYKTVQISSLPTDSGEAIKTLKILYEECDFLRISIDEDPPKEILHLVIGFVRVTPRTKLDNVKLRKSLGKVIEENAAVTKENEFIKSVKALNFRDATKLWAKEVMNVEVNDEMIDDAIAPV